jgi:hypothetical protein
MVLITLQDDKDTIAHLAVADDPARDPSLGMDAGEKMLLDAIGDADDAFDVDIIIMFDVLTPIVTAMSAMRCYMGTGEFHLEEGGHAAIVDRELHVDGLDTVAFFLKKDFLNHTLGPTVGRIPIDVHGITDLVSDETIWTRMAACCTIDDGGHENL